MRTAFFAVLLAANVVAADVVVRVVGPDQKPVGNFAFTTRPSTSKSYSDTQTWKTDARGECRLVNLKAAPQHILAWATTWTEAGLMEKGNQVGTLREGEPFVLKLRPTVIPKGSVAASLQTCARVLSSFCLDREDRFLVCDVANKRLRVVSAEDTLVRDLSLGFAPQVVACREDGVIAVAGTGKIALLSPQGAIQAEASLPGQSRTATAIGAHGKDVFVCVQAKTGYVIYRLDERLQNPIAIIQGLRGCCGQMDFKVRDGKLYVAHNVKFLIETYDRDGKLLSSFGKRDNGTSESFKGCCEPKNICFDCQGNLYTAESANWTVKKFSPDGRYIQFFGAIAEDGDCVRAAIACTRDNRIYILDHPRNIIRPVLPGKSKDVATNRS